MRRIILVVLFIFFLVMIILGFVFWQNSQKIASISSFEECANAGYPIMESYPEQCTTPDGRSFTQELPVREIPPTENTPDPLCEDRCGDGECQEIVCLGSGCACAESSETCPQDCQNGDQ